MSNEDKIYIKLFNRSDKTQEYQFHFNSEERLSNVIKLFNKNLQKEEKTPDYFFNNLKIDIENSNIKLKEFFRFSNKIKIEFDWPNNFLRPFSVTNGRNIYSNHFTVNISQMDSQSNDESARTSVSNTVENEIHRKNTNPNRRDSTSSNDSLKIFNDNNRDSFLNKNTTLQKKHRRSCTNSDSDSEEDIHSKKYSRKYSNDVLSNQNLKKFKRCVDDIKMKLDSDNSFSDENDYENINYVKFLQRDPMPQRHNEDELEEGEILPDFDVENRKNKIGLNINLQPNLKEKISLNNLVRSNNTLHDNSSSSSEYLSESSFEKNLRRNKNNYVSKYSEYRFKTNEATKSKMKYDKKYDRENYLDQMNAFDQLKYLLAASSESNENKNSKENPLSIVLDDKNGVSDKVQEEEVINKINERKVENHAENEKCVFINKESNMIEVNAINSNDISKELNIIALPDDSADSIKNSSVIINAEILKEMENIIQKQEKIEEKINLNMYSVNLSENVENEISSMTCDKKDIFSNIYDYDSEPKDNIIGLNILNKNPENVNNNINLNLNVDTEHLEDGNNTSTNLDFYDAYFQIKDDAEMDSFLPEIENMMKSIQISEQAKSMMRRNYELKIPILKNRKEETILNYPVEYSYLSSIPFSFLKTKLINQEFKLNLILDIDSTLIYAEPAEKIITYDRETKLSEDIHYIAPTLGTCTYRLGFKIRKNVIVFLQKVSKFCNIYFNTHGHEAYALEILKILSVKAQIDFKKENLYGVKEFPFTSHSPKNLRVFSTDENFHSHSLILDDNVRAWDGQFIDNLILSLKYQVFFSDKKFEEKQLKQNESMGKYSYTYLFAYNRPQECNDFVMNFVDEKNAPYSMEYENSTKSQISYIIELIENVYKLCVLQKVNAITALRKIKENVLHGVNLNLEFLSVDGPSKQNVKEMVRLLGGSIEISDSTSSHYIISNYKLNDFIQHKTNNVNFKNKKTFFVNLKWLFHCYFFMKKLDENDQEYRLIF